MTSVACNMHRREQMQNIQVRAELAKQAHHARMALQACKNRGWSSTAHRCVQVITKVGQDLRRH